MRKIVFGTMLMMLLAGHVKSQDFENFPITKVRISKNTLLYKTGLTDSYPNMLAVKTSAGIVVFDALQYPKVALRVREMIVKDLKGEVIYLVNTHGPIDHTGGNIVFKDVPIIGSASIKAASDNLAAIGKNP